MGVHEGDGEMVAGRAGEEKDDQEGNQQERGGGDAEGPGAPDGNNANQDDQEKSQDEHQADQQQPQVAVERYWAGRTLCASPSQKLREARTALEARMPMRNASENHSSGRKEVSLSKGVGVGWSVFCMRIAPGGSIVKVMGGKDKGG